MGRPPYRDGRVHVLSARCHTCVFRPGNLMKLTAGRLRELVDDNIAADSALTCHSTLYRPEVDEAVCKGFFDAYWQETAPLRLARYFDVVTYVDPPAKERA